MRLCTTARSTRGARALAGAASCAITAIALTTFTAPPAGADTGPWYGGDVVEIQTHADKCFDVSGASTDDRAPIVQYGCDNKAHQRFRLRHLPDGSVAIQTFSGKCLDVMNASTEDRAPLIQFRCHGNPNQRFHLEPASRGRVVVHTAAGKCLDVREGHLNDGVPIVQWSCHGVANQRFYVVPARPWPGM
ncbi:Gll4251 protein [[Actinomadura] parvosata subsp. kistnae]|uniref:RICIN domain-containing protein n=1 Tax=[Actinomadura] parvosata TaxID=1955412 RepID=UPI000D2953B2|nr:RICIN domain-containing protein [Nonomuraea sp. ATCC 55076]SPL91441.1 Gll4251 protein [Actinomadura parvosata subsp. kistnae]